LYQRDIYAPFVELAYWGSSSNEQKKEYLSDVRPIFTANATHKAAKSVSTEAIPIAQYESKYYYPSKGDESLALTPEPTHVLRVLASAFPPRAGSETKAASTASEGNDIDESDGDEEGELSMQVFFAVGVRDGKYYFCTIKRD
jgi:hypothetical protein